MFILACAGLQASEARESGSGSSAPPVSVASVVLIVGAPGAPEFRTNFLQQAEQWSRAAETGGARLATVGLNEPPGSEEGADLERLKQCLSAEAVGGLEPLWIVLIGHGTFDGKEARFNLRGPDFTATELAEWLKPFSRPLVVVNLASASAPFLAKLAHPNRVVITATRSGNEQNFAHLGSFLARTLTDPASDFDQDRQVSLLEAWLNAAAQLAEFYQTAGRLATEHPLLDDNGDGRGTPADWFRGVRAIRKAKDDAPLDGLQAHQVHLIRSAEEQALSPETRARRDALELEVFRLRETKDSFKDDEEAYYRRLEVLLLGLARLQASPDS